MEQKTEEPQIGGFGMKSFLKKTVKISKYTIPVWTLMLLAGSVVAAVVFGVVSLTATVKEPLSVSPTDVSFDVFAGETKTTTLTLANLAMVSEKAKISFVEVDNPSGVTYTVSFSPSDTSVIPALGSNTIDAIVSVNPDSPIGTLKLSFNLERIA